MNWFLNYSVSCVMSGLLTLVSLLLQIIIFFCEVVIKYICSEDETKRTVINFFMFLTVFILCFNLVCLCKQTYHTAKIEEFPQDQIYFGQTINDNIANGKGRIFDSEGRLLYIGHFLNNQKQGTGKCYQILEIDNVAQSVLVYDGSYEKDLYDGCGKLYVSSGDRVGELLYEGEFKKGQFCGTGKLYYDDGNYYEGGFSEGKKCGYGTETITKSKEDGSTEVYVIRGTFYGDQRHGFVEEYEDGKLIFQGNYLYGKREDKNAEEYYMNGNPKYVGNYKMGYRDGEGKCYYESGQLQYEGEFSNGWWNGMGEQYNSSGQLIYKGQFKNGMYEGSGSLYSKDGSLLYEGGFANGLYNGDGKKYEKGVLVYEGEFYNGRYNGKGTYYKEGILRYQGEFKNDNWVGTGSCYSTTDGALLYEGEYLNGTPYGYGVLYYSDGTIKYSGNFVNNRYHGYGMLYDETGAVVYEGEWENGEKVN